MVSKNGHHLQEAALGTSESGLGLSSMSTLPASRAFWLGTAGQGDGAQGEGAVGLTGWDPRANTHSGRGPGKNV